MTGGRRMMKRAVLAVIATFVAWSILDVIIHGLLIQSSYQDTAHLWRPMDEMNMPLMYGVTLAWAWFLGTRVEAITAGALVGVILISQEETS
jgi:hypothetical protein